MVLGVVTSNGDVMPPHFLEQNEKFNADFYLRVLETIVLPWIQGRRRDGQYILCYRLQNIKPSVKLVRFILFSAIPLIPAALRGTHVALRH